MNVCAFEPGSLALAAYLLHSGLPLERRRKGHPCREIKRFIKRHRHGLVDVALDEIASPALDLVNANSHAAVDLLHLPMPTVSSWLAVYFAAIIIAILA
jgi:hypothetical protein